MNEALKQSYSLYDTVYGNDTPIEQYYMINFGELPSKFSLATTYDNSVLDHIKSNGFELIHEIYVNTRKYDQSARKLFVNQDKNILIKTNEGIDKPSGNLVTIEFAYNRLNGSFSEQLDFLELTQFERKKKKSNINLIKNDMGHLDTEEYDLKIPTIDLALNYGEDFIKIHEVIESRLNKPNDKGIILLHGEPGSGKTTYIKFLTGIVKDKEILFIPPSMAEMLSEPSIIPFLMEHKNSILIIEDAEKVISDREINGSSAGISNILNLTDGILGDCLNIQILATFNMKKEKIDKALLRKGRLIAEHKFDKLSINDSNKLLIHLQKDYIASEPMCLADIYNIDVEVYKSEEKTTKIGF
jgi:energy-coupling factor transporter ATP-binding protein EcfA2